MYKFQDFIFSIQILRGCKHGHGRTPKGSPSRGSKMKMGSLNFKFSKDFCEKGNFKKQIYIFGRYLVF